MCLKKLCESVWSVLELAKKILIKERIRHITQALFALVTNGYAAGFIKGTIYQGSGKHLCVPGMNCYSCPGAYGSCPIGSLQAVVGSYKYKFSYYVTGIIFLFGAIFGRFICGFLCPFGLVQDLVHKIPSKKIKTFKGDKLLRKLKYLILVVFVFILPLFVVDFLGQGAPAFCKYICPVGTLEGGLFLVLLNPSMRAAVGLLYLWKNFILISLIILSVFIYRPFCKYICPLGAIYSFFNKHSFFRYQVDLSSCIHCGACSRACQMNVNPVEDANHSECIRCGRCKAACPKSCIHSGILKPSNRKEPSHAAINR